MRNFKQKIVSVLTALAMVLSVVSAAFPSNVFASEAAPASTDKTDVVIHKLKLNDLNGWPKSPGNDGTIQGVGQGKYDGSKIENKLEYFGAGVEELEGVEFSYWKVTEEQYKAMTAASSMYDTLEKVKEYVGTDPVKTVKTGAEGVTVEGLVDGHYWFIENLGSTLGGANAGKTLSKAAAVPFGLALPVYKSTGARFTTGENALHVYPKNTVSDKPKTDKVFGDENTDLNNPQRDKGKKDVFVGQEVPYKVETEIPANAKYKTAKWSDYMTEGLTLNQNSFKITIGDTAADSADYTIEKTDRGYTLNLTSTGLAKVNDKEAPVLVKIEYSATVNNKAVVDIPEANDVTFHYGNNPSNGNTPIPTKPKDGEIEVKKTFADGVFPEGVNVTITLFNAQTGERVPGVDPVVLNSTKTSHKFTGLDADTEYKAVETYISGYEAEYKVEEQGKIVINNHKNPNPEPQRPSSPKVVTGGHRFQKVDASTKAGLKGAEFVVKNEENKFLAKKDANQTAIEAADYAAAEKAYLDAVKGNAQADEVARLKAVRDAAYVAANIEWKWVEAEGDAAKFVSGDDGFFKVTGLAYGNYKLKETKAPEGYAQLTEEIAFEVKANSANEATRVDEKTVEDANLTVIDNKKITIPQTGGIGTVIFTVVGITIMAAAVIAMRRNSRVEE